MEKGCPYTVLQILEALAKCKFKPLRGELQEIFDLPPTTYVWDPGGKYVVACSTDEVGMALDVLPRAQKKGKGVLTWSIYLPVLTEWERGLVDIEEE